MDTLLDNLFNKEPLKIKEGAISHQWTDQDRLSVAFLISCEMKIDRPLTIDKLHHMANRLDFVTTKSAEFLETRRQYIITGDVESLVRV